MCLLLVEFSARAKENLNPIDLPGFSGLIGGCWKLSFSCGQHKFSCGFDLGAWRSCLSHVFQVQSKPKPNS